MLIVLPTRMENVRLLALFLSMEKKSYAVSSVLLKASHQLFTVHRQPSEAPAREEFKEHHRRI